MNGANGFHRKGREGREERIEKATAKSGLHHKEHELFFARRSGGATKSGGHKERKRDSNGTVRGRKKKLKRTI